MVPSKVDYFRIPHKSLLDNTPNWGYFNVLKINGKFFMIKRN